jgi:hypothetical protein
MLENAFIFNFTKQNFLTKLFLSNKTPNIVFQLNKG